MPELYTVYNFISDLFIFFMRNVCGTVNATITTTPVNQSSLTISTMVHP